MTTVLFRNKKFPFQSTQIRKKKKYKSTNNSLWITQTGRQVRVCDMSDNHLINCINYLHKRADDALEAYLDGLSASYNVSNEEFALLEKMPEFIEASAKSTLEAVPEIWFEMIDEAQYRELTLPRWFDEFRLLYK